MIVCSLGELTAIMSLKTNEALLSLGGWLRVGDLDPRLITVQELLLCGKTLKKAANSPNNCENKTRES